MTLLSEVYSNASPRTWFNDLFNVHTKITRDLNGLISVEFQCYGENIFPGRFVENIVPIQQLLKSLHNLHTVTFSNCNYIENIDLIEIFKVPLPTLKRINFYRMFNLDQITIVDIKSHVNKDVLFEYYDCNLLMNEVEQEKEEEEEEKVCYICIFRIFGVIFVESVFCLEKI